MNIRWYGAAAVLAAAAALAAPAFAQAPTNQRVVSQARPGSQCAGFISPASFVVQAPPADCGGGVRAPVRPTAHNQPGTWTGIADYPVPIVDNCMATDESTGNVYSVGGWYVDPNTGDGAPTDKAYMYDPGDDTWSPLAQPLPEPIEKPACAFIQGKLYVAAGWNVTGGPTQHLYIYDPIAQGWTQGPDLPNPHAGGAGMAVLHTESTSGMRFTRFYVVGGCLDGSCDGTDAVDVYNPVTQMWHTVTPYPHPVGWESCGGIGSRVYCAGGVSVVATVVYSDGYAYDPSIPALGWSAIRKMPADSDGCRPQWGGGYVAIHDKLAVFNGIRYSDYPTCNGTSYTSDTGFFYNPATNAWHVVPASLNTPVPDYRMGSACGFYMVGGNPFDGSTFSEVLPGYGTCTPTLQGRVYDSSYFMHQHYPLFARVKIKKGSQYDTVWTDPRTGFYSAMLPAGTYHLSVETQQYDFPGYAPASATVTTVAPPVPALQQDFPLGPTSACVAPGYMLNMNNGNCVAIPGGLGMGQTTVSGSPTNGIPVLCYCPNGGINFSSNTAGWNGLFIEFVPAGTSRHLISYYSSMYRLWTIPIMGPGSVRLHRFPF